MLRKNIIILFFFIITTAMAHTAYAGGKEVLKMTEHIHWLGHDTFKFTGEKVIYTDPFKLKKRDTADIILVTHEHYDHCSPEDIRKIQGSGTTIVATPDCAGKLTGNVKTVKPGDTIEIEGIRIEAVPSYNIDKQFHTKDKNWVGYVFTLNGRRIYLAGDTDHIPEMKSLENIDIALLPVSGTYVMTAEEAVRAALEIKPSLAIPMHYNSIVGTEKDAKKFAEGLKGKVEVKILGEE